MRCHEFEARLNSVLDRRGDPRLDRCVARHAEHCGRCRRLLDAYVGLCEGLTDLAAPKAPDDLPQRVLCEVARPSAPSRSRWPAAWVTAAAVVLVIWSVRDRSPELREVETPVAASRQPLSSATVAAAQAPLPASPPVGVLARQATEEYADLARDTQSAFADVSRLLPRLNDNAFVVDYLDDATQTSSPLTTQVAVGLKPLADTMTGAMSFLWNMLPHSQPANASLEQPPAATVEPLPRTDTI